MHSISSHLLKPVPMRGMIRLSGIRFILPYYHLVSGETPAHVKYLFPVRTPDSLNKDLDFLAQQFHPVTLDELINIVHNGEKRRKPVYHLLFYNGLCEFHDIIAPVLHKKGIPATCFLNDKCIDNQSLYYRFKSSLLIDRLRSKKPGSEEWCLFHQWELANDLNGKYYRKVLLDITLDREYLLDELAQVIHVDFGEYLKREQPFLTTQQIKSLISQGFSFGTIFTGNVHNDKSNCGESFASSVENIQSHFNLSHSVLAADSNLGTGVKELTDYLRTNEKYDLCFGNTSIPKENIKNYLTCFSAEISGKPMKQIIKAHCLRHLLM